MQLLQPLSLRVLSRIREAKKLEPDAWIRDDLDIAYLTVLYAARGDAVECSPDVLASYEVLGLHPEKVWPRIQARRHALGWVQFVDAASAPKKPPQSVKLWPSEKNKSARAINSRAAWTKVLREPTTSVPMATVSLAAGYPNSDAPSSGKRGEYFYEEAIRIIKRSGAPGHVRQLTLDALAVRGDWPKKKGPITNVITVSIRSLQDEAGVYRSTIQRRIRRATKDKYWRELHPINHWLNCPKCGAARESAQCPKCPHKGNGHNPEEFRTTITHAIDFEKFVSAVPCRQVRVIRELRARRSPDGVTQMPSPKPAEKVPPQNDPPPATAAPVKQPAAEHAHRNSARPLQPKLSKTECAKLIADMAVAMKGYTRHVESVGGYGYDLDPSDPRYKPKRTWREALKIVCERWQRTEESVVEAFKLHGYRIEPDSV